MFFWILHIQVHFFYGRSSPLLASRYCPDGCQGSTLNREAFFGWTSVPLGQMTTLHQIIRLSPPPWMLSPQRDSGLVWIISFYTCIFLSWDHVPFQWHRNFCLMCVVLISFKQCFPCLLCYIIRSFGISSLPFVVYIPTPFFWLVIFPVSPFEKRPYRPIFVRPFKSWIIK